MAKTERAKLFSATVMTGMLALSVTAGLRQVHADMSGYAVQTASTVGGFGGNTTGGSQATAAKPQQHIPTRLLTVRRC